MLFFIISLVVLGCQQKPNNYEDCILQNLKEDMNDSASEVVIEACREKFPESSSLSSNEGVEKDTEKSPTALLDENLTGFTTGNIEVRDRTKNTNSPYYRNLAVRISYEGYDGTKKVEVEDQEKQHYSFRFKFNYIDAQITDNWNAVRTVHPWEFTTELESGNYSIPSNRVFHNEKMEINFKMEPSNSYDIYLILNKKEVSSLQRELEMGNSLTLSVSYGYNDPFYRETL